MNEDLESLYAGVILNLHLADGTNNLRSLATRLPEQIDVSSSDVDIVLLYTIALAPALARVERFTTFTILRTPRCTNRYHFLRSARRFYSTPTRRLSKEEDGGKKDQGSALDILKDLLPITSQPREGKSETTHGRGDREAEDGQPRASFVPKIKQYINESATDRWRSRHVLGTRSSTKDLKAGNEPPSSSTTTTVPSETTWTRAQIATLRPPYQDRSTFTPYRQPSHSVRGMRNHIQLLTTPTADTPGTTLLLHFDNKRYLVGSLAEGTQRACVQMGARMLKVQECFLTGRTEWRNTGGLIGMILTLADAVQSSRESSLEEAAGKARARGRRQGLVEGGEEMERLVEEARREVREARLCVFGPPGLNYGLATARRFVFRKGMPVDLHEIREGKQKEADAVGKEGEEREDEWAPYWADENIKVWAMSVSPAPSRPITSSNGTRTVSPRKRSVDEAELDERAKTTAPDGTVHTPAAELSQADKDALTTKAVVGEMFNSSWRLDTLYETPLSQVNLPATIFVRNPETKKVEKYRGPLPGGGKEVPDPDMTVLVRKPWPGALVESLPPPPSGKEAVSYIIKNHRQRGKFFPNKAMECKVEKGKKWSLLQSGESVTNSEGETVTPEMVLGESKEGGGVAIVDLPGKVYIGPLLARPEWREQKVMAGVGAVVWSLGEGVLGDERVQAFVRELRR